MYNANILYGKPGKIKHRMCIVISQAIILTLFMFVINNQSQACCYFAGYNFYYGVSACTTAEECTEPAEMNGCSVNEVRPGYYIISCNGESSGCGVNPNINCCAVYPDSYGCIGNNPDPCFSNPDDPCCGNRQCDKTPANQCAAPLEHAAPASGDGAGFAGE